MAAVQRATWPDQRIVRSTLANLVRDMGDAHISDTHAMILAGWALDPNLIERADGHRSKLYDKTFTHRYRRGVVATEGGRTVTKPYAVMAITKHGVQIARHLPEGFPLVDVYYPDEFRCRVTRRSAPSALSRARSWRRFRRCLNDIEASSASCRLARWCAWLRRS